METKYSADIESRRTDYERLAQSFLTMCELDGDRHPDLLDFESQYDEAFDHILLNAMNEHMKRLCFEFDWFTAQGMQLYVELRLALDQQRKDTHEAYLEYERKSRKGRAA